MAHVVTSRLYQNLSSIFDAGRNLLDRMRLTSEQMNPLPLSLGRKATEEMPSSLPSQKVLATSRSEVMGSMCHSNQVVFDTACDDSGIWNARVYRK